jgi:hypothetical protein
MDLISLLLDFSHQIKFWHLKTDDYVTHVVLGELYEEIQDDLDSLLEISLVLYPDQADKGYSYDIQKYESKEVCLEYIRKNYSVLDKAKETFDDSAVVTLLDNLKIIYLNKIYKLKLEC